jgi:hypothetical protein
MPAAEFRAEVMLQDPGIDPVVDIDYIIIRAELVYDVIRQCTLVELAYILRNRLQ